MSASGRARWRSSPEPASSDGGNTTDLPSGMVVTAPFVLTRELLPALIASKGRVINVCSTAARKGFKYTVEDETNALIKQRPEKPFLGFIPNYRSWIFLKRKCGAGQSQSRFRKWACNNVAQPPVVFNKELAERSESNLRNYIHSRGYFDAKVTHEVKISGKKAHVTYHIEPGKVYRIESLAVVCPDSSIQLMLNKYQKSTFLRPGQPLDIKLFDREKTRITSFLRNSGHALFLPNYLEFEADTTNRMSKVEMRVLPFSQKNADHPTLSIGNITVASDYNPRRPAALHSNAGTADARAAA